MAVEQNASDIEVNPLLVEFTLVPYMPQQQLDDVLLDVHMTGWGFQGFLTHRELMLSDPVYRQEQNLRAAKLPSHFANTSLLREERERETKEVKEDLPIKPPLSFVQEDDASI